MSDVDVRMVPAVHRWANNADMVRDVARLGYLDGRVLDATYGHGRFWVLWRPEQLTAHDIDPAKAPDGPADFTCLPYEPGSFEAVVLDGPYRLNGTPDPTFDEPYGTDKAASWQERHALIRDGITEAARIVRRGGHVLVKCQDQVCSGAVRWQTFEFTAHAQTVDLDLVDRFDLLGTARPQPMEGRTQRHAHGRPSTLLVFRAADRLTLDLETP